MFLQTLLLALTERGLGGCVEASIARCPEIVRAVGYPDGTVDPLRFDKVDHADGGAME
jgi:hypothetical protein